MSGSHTIRIAAAVALVMAMAGVAVLSARHFLRGPVRRFEPRQLSARDLARIDELIAQVLAAGPEELAARVRQAAGPTMRSEDLPGLLAALHRMKQAQRWRRVAADGWGPTLIKAIFQLAGGGEPGAQVVLLFERSGDGIRLLGADN